MNYKVLAWVLSAVVVSVSATATDVAALQGNRSREAADEQDSTSWQLELSLKARTLLVDPVVGEIREVETPSSPMGHLSPDQSKVVFIGSDPDRVAAGFAFDLFVADVDLEQPAGKANIRRITTEQHHPSSPFWLPDSQHIAFLAGPDRTSMATQVWVIDVGDGGVATRVSAGDAERLSQLSVTSEGDVAYVSFKSREGKLSLSDLVRAKLGMRDEERAVSVERSVVVTNQFISSYQFGPQAKLLAWSGLGGLHLVDLSTGEADEIPLHGIHRQLVNHTAYQIAWHPNAGMIAMTCGFLGGVSQVRGEEAPPRMFAGDKIFFVPTQWRPSPEQLEFPEGERFPSPFADDPDAEVSPEAGDQSAPWWTRHIPTRPLRIRWRDDSKIEKATIQ